MTTLPAPKITATETRRFVLDISIDPAKYPTDQLDDEGTPVRPDIAAADELLDLLTDLPEELYPAWLFSVDGVEPE